MPQRPVAGAAQVTWFNVAYLHNASFRIFGIVRASRSGLFYKVEVIGKREGYARNRENGMTMVKRVSRQGRIATAVLDRWAVLLTKIFDGQIGIKRS